MRVAVLSRNFSVRGGGAERYSIALVEQWAQQHEVHVFAQHLDAQIPGVQMHRVPAPMERPRWINQLYFAWATWRATRKGFDVVLSHENTWHGNVQVVHVLPVRYTLFQGRSGWALALRWLKVATSPRLLAYLWLEASRYRRTPGRKLVVTSDWLRQAMVQAYPRAEFMVHTITPGVASVPGATSPADQQAARVQLGLEPGATWLLLVANDLRRKGLPALLQAMERLPLQVHLAVVGQGDELSAMQKLAAPLGARVRFLGALQDVSVAYRAADVLVHPTLEDTYSMVVLEAMAHGLPVVVSGARYCGIAAELQSGRQALLLEDPTDCDALALGLADLLGNPVLRLEMVRAGVEFASARSWLHVAQRYEALLQPPAQRWLVLAHAFNMDGRAASQTITDKIPHLRAAGIELVVMSGVSGTLDRGVEHYQLWPSLPAGIKFELRHVLRKHLGQGALYRAVSLMTSLVLLPGMLVEKLLRPVESSWSWWITAYLKGRSVLRSQHFDLIYSTGGAFAAHIAGRALQKATGLRWLAEVHDPMVTPGHVPETAQEKMQAQVESTICGHADVAVWFTDAALESARSRHPELGGRGHRMLPGIDNPFVQPMYYRAGRKLVLSHFGSLSATRNLVPVLGAMEWLSQTHHALAAQLELHVYGGPLDALSAQKLSASLVAHQVFHHGRIEADPLTGQSGREQILRLMRGADALLLLHGLESICAEYIPSKLYEYLWMQRPIVAVVEGNDQMEQILRSQGHWPVRSDQCAPRGQGALLEVVLGQVLASLLEQWSTEGLPDSGQVSPYTTQRAVEQLLHITAEVRA